MLLGFFFLDFYLNDHVNLFTTKDTAKAVLLLRRLELCTLSTEVFLLARSEVLYKAWS